MISWMQKHNKYLIVTIWIATIAFIGAGFVGWGSYQYGSKASAVGKVGDIEILQERLDMTYQNLYSQYNELYQGKFDEAKAKELGLIKLAFQQLTTQAQLLNLAKEYGIIVNDQEVSRYIISLEAFFEDGVFNKNVYRAYLKRRRMKPKTFESVIRDQLVMEKFTGLLGQDSLPFEAEILASAMSISDKIAYEVHALRDMNVTLDEVELRKFWEQTKADYMTKQAYELTILWTDSKDTGVTDDALRSFFEKNSFNYTDAQGKQFTFEKAKGIVTQDYKVKKSKKQALLDYVAFKKGELKATETVTMAQGSSKLSQEVWKTITEGSVGDTLKPKAVGTRYATVKIIKSIAPKQKVFDSAKAEAAQRLTKQKRSMALEAMAQATLKGIDSATSPTTTEWLTMSKYETMTPLNQEETGKFLQKLFTSSAKKGIIALSDTVVIYKIIDQKMGAIDSNLTSGLQSSIDRIKRSVFEGNLFKALHEKFPVEAYVKGL